MSDYLPLIIVCAVWLLCWGIGVRMTVWHEVEDYITLADFGGILLVGVFAPIVALVGAIAASVEWFHENSDRPLLRVRPRKQLPKHEPPTRGDWT